MDNPGLYSLGDATLGAAVVDEVITRGSGPASSVQEFIDRLGGMTSVNLWVEFFHGGGGTTCIIVVQTSLNQGEDWIDIARFDFATASRKAHAAVAVVASAAPANIAALSAEGILANQLGDRLRAKVTSTGTYTGATSIGVRAAVR